MPQEIRLTWMQLVELAKFWVSIKRLQGSVLSVVLPPNDGWQELRGATFVIESHNGDSMSVSWDELSKVREFLRSSAVPGNSKDTLTEFVLEHIAPDTQNQILLHFAVSLISIL